MPHTFRWIKNPATTVTTVCTAFVEEAAGEKLSCKADYKEIRLEKRCIVCVV